ncbi:MAG TPA: hypothetical protein ENJ19_07490 [Gammaproteobacteria bacterium]|nr:hypothetical protein [Gammaproteobacteria bacterium]
MPKSTRLLPLICAAALAASAPAQADPDHHACRLKGSYGYVYDGTSYTPSGPVALSETGFFAFAHDGSASSEGTLTFQFTDFGGTGPIWLTLKEVLSNITVTPEPGNPCHGAISFQATATVTKTSDPSRAPAGLVLFTNSPRSLAYTISGKRNDIITVISTSPGTIASGTAYKQSRQAQRRH